MLGRPGDLPAAMAALPPTTFTADARYEIYAATLTVASTGLDLAVQRTCHWLTSWAGS